MDSQYIWNLLVREVKNSFNKRESEVQRLWESFFADSSIFGYSRFAGEVDAQRSIQIGSHQRTIPDIIIRDSSQNQDLFLVELKQHNLPYHETYKAQMFSYMKLLGLQIGILVYNKLAVCYMESNQQDSFIEIPFEENNENGIKFIELFAKHNYNEQSVISFIEKHKKFKQNVQFIKTEIKNISLVDLLKSYYQDKYSLEEIQSATKGLCICSNSNYHVQQTIQYTARNTVFTNSNKSSTNYIVSNNLDKNGAIQLFKQNGVIINGKVTYSSKNSTQNLYWANPRFNLLNRDWYLILNDVDNKKLYLFYMPQNTFVHNQFIPRSDRPELIDLQIMYNDSSFTDTRSKTSFRSYLIHELSY